MLTTVLASCAIVLPLQNTGTDHGRIVTYRDRGDVIVYSVKPSRAFRRAVEGMRGSGRRVVCDSGNAR